MVACKVVKYLEEVEPAHSDGQVALSDSDPEPPLGVSL